MLSVQLRAEVNERSIQGLVGRHVQASDYSLALTDNASVFKPNGQRLITLLRSAITHEASEAAYPFFHWLRHAKSANRGAYVGVPRGAESGLRKKRRRKDGTLSNTNIAVGEPVRSAIVGFFDRYPRIPYCRETALSTEKPEEWGACLPFIQQAAALFQEHVPERYQAQLEAAKKTHPAYVLPGTPFTTVTVNNCVAGGYHRDAGDYGPGFGVIVVLRRGQYRGCDLVFPKYRCAVDLQDRDVILFDPHEVHGNAPFFDQQGEEGKDWERISLVLYFRTKILDCLAPVEELARAKARGMISEE